MKIGTLHTLYGRKAGAEMLTERILLGIPEAFPDTTFVVYCNREAYASLPDHAGIEKRYLSALDSQYAKALWLQFQSGRQLRQDSADMFWVPSGCNAFPGSWPIPSLVTFLDFGEYHVPRKYDRKRTLYRKLLCIPLSVRRGTAFTAISRSTADDLYRMFGKRAAVIYPGASPRPPREAATDPAAIVRQETGGNFQRVILVPGRTDFYGKGLDILLDAYKAFSARVSAPPPLVLVGPAGEHHESLLREIARLRLGETVRWLGRVSDACLDALYQLAKFVVFPSRFEGFGFPLLEAMQHGTPIISSDAGSLPEIAGNAALIYPSGDSLALAAAMERLLADPELADKLVSAGRVRFDAFQWQSCFSAMHEQFTKIMAARP